MSEININLIKFTQGSRAGAYGVCVDAFPIYAVYDEDGQRIIHWNARGEGYAEEEVELGLRDLTPYARWAQDNDYEIVRLDYLTPFYMEMLIRVGQQIEQRTPHIAYCRSNFSVQGSKMLSAETMASAEYQNHFLFYGEDYQAAR